MSRSWTSVLGARPPVGLDLGRDAVTAAVLTRQTGGWALRNAVQTPLSTPLFQGAATPLHEQALTEALARVRRELGAASRAAQVAVPDPVVSLRVFELERMPSSRRLRDELVRWRFAREFARDAADFACAHQVYGQERGRPLLLGLAMAADWAALVQRACRAAGFLVTALDMRSCHRHNRLRSLLTADGSGGALVALDPDAWSLSVWDEAGRLRLVRSRMLEPGAAEPAPAVADSAIATEIERTVRAYAQSTGERSLGRLFVMGPGTEAGRMAEQLDARLRERCTVLPTHAGLYDPPVDAPPVPLPEPWGLAAPAITTAIPR